MTAGDRQAVETLSRARDAAADPGERARIVLRLTQAVGISGAVWRLSSHLERAAETLEGIDRDLALQIEVEIIAIARLAPESREWAERRLRELEPRAAAASPATVGLLANLALLALEDGRPADEVAAYAERALDGGWLWTQSGFHYSYAANALTWIDRFDAAREAWDAALEDIGRTTPVAATLAYSMRSHLRMRTGDVRGAESDIQIAADIARQYDHYDWDAALPYLAAFEADALLERDIPAAGKLVDRTGDWEEQTPFFLDARGRWRLAAGDPERAVEDFLASGETLRIRGGRDCPCVVPWRSNASIAMLRAGRQEEAARLADEELELARPIGAPRAIGLATRAAGLAALDGDRGVELLTEAVSLLEASGARLDHARALVDLGSALRRRRRPADARVPLRQALDLAERCASTLLAEQARVELHAAGARPRRAAITGVDALTASERRVAELVAGGMTNRQVAQALFVSMRTVAVHLTSVYQKLGIAGREELAGALDVGSGPAGGDATPGGAAEAVSP
jgi:DNA-binding CsgD family transcriptional regulator